jgi:GT2 family glycosyltransferase
MSMPRVSIIIPAYFSHDTLAECLNALRSQTYRDFEICLVNSSPETITEALVGRQFPEVNFHQSPTRLYPHAARNLAIERSRGELLVLTDPDCRAHPDWLEKLVAAHDAGHLVVGGAMGLASDRWFEQGAHLTKFSWLLSGLPPGPRWIVPSANALYPRSLFEQIGPMDGELFCGDALLAWRAADAGAAPWFEPAAIVEHRHEGNLVSFFQLRFRRGREFAQARIAFEGWSRAKAAVHALCVPMLVLLTLQRSGSDAFRAGWGRRYVLTLFVQGVAQTGWCLGEAIEQARAALRGAAGPSRRKEPA